MSSNDNLEIERKFLVKEIPDLGEGGYESKKLVQGYLNTAPVVRVRREGDEYFLTYKSKGLMRRIEYNLPLNCESFEHLIKKCDGKIISKTRYFIPLEGTAYTVELDIFDEPFEGLIIAEIEFPTMEEAEGFCPPSWLAEDVTNDVRYHNSYLSRC